jgi:phosphatidylglycerophosphate synthase
MPPTDPAPVAKRSYRATLGNMDIAKKPGRGAPPYSRWINRRLGKYLAAAAYVIGLTPDQVTVLSACFTFAALILVIVITPVWWLGILVAALLLMGYALDSADGQLARVRGGGSRAGEWLDHIVDATKIGVMHSAVLISFYRFSGERALVLVVPLVFVTASFVFFFGMILTDQLRRSAAADAGHKYSKPSGPGGGFQTLVAIPTDYGLVCLSFVLLGAHEIFVTVYSLLAFAQVLITAGVLVRWWLELRRTDSLARL